MIPTILILILSGVLLYTQFRTGMGMEQELLASGAQNIQRSIQFELAQSFEILRNISVNPTDWTTTTTATLRSSIRSSSF